MRDVDGREGPRFTVVGWTILVTVAVFVIQNIAAFWFRWDGVTRFLGALPEDALSGKVWKLLTYTLAHDVGQLLHILFNMLMLAWVGRSVLDETGPRRWLWIYWTSALFGSVVFTLLYLALGKASLLIGASAAVYGLIGFISTLHPDRTAYLFFIEMRQKWIAWTLAGIGIFGLIVWEIPGAGGTAHSAHLAGMLGGFLAARFNWFSEPFGMSDMRMPSWWQRRRAVEPVTRNYSVNISKPTREPEPDASTASLRSEVDRILDKINSEGFQSLTSDERAFLDRAKEELGRR